MIRSHGARPHLLEMRSLAGGADAAVAPPRRVQGLPSELHVCRLCVEYDTRVAKHCREPTAEEVRDKTQANFCDHFKPKVGAYVAPTGEADAARSALDALFGKK